MNRLVMPFVAVVALLAASGTSADDKPAAALTRAELDERIYKLLRDVINRGAMVHNAGDPAGCYRIFQGSLMTLAPQLDHRPPLQEAIAKGLKTADQLPDASDRAFALREVIDHIRATLKKDQKEMPPAKEPAKP